MTAHLGRVACLALGATAAGYLYNTKLLPATPSKTQLVSSRVLTRMLVSPRVPEETSVHAPIPDMVKNSRR